jgi:hypothetical protein
MVCGNTSKASDCEPVGPDKLKARSDIDQEKLLMVQGMVSQEIASKMGLEKLNGDFVL